MINSLKNPLSLAYPYRDLVGWIFFQFELNLPKWIGLSIQIISLNNINSHIAAHNKKIALRDPNFSMVFWLILPKENFEIGKIIFEWYIVKFTNFHEM